jgi:hypothetical protein
MDNIKNTPPNRQDFGFIVQILAFLVILIGYIGYSFANIDLMVGVIVFGILVLTYIIFRRPYVGVFAILLSIFFEYFFNFSLYLTLLGNCGITKLVVPSILIIWILKYLIERKSFVNVPEKIPFLLFLSICMLSIFKAPYPDKSIMRIISFSGLFIIYILIINLIRSSYTLVKLFYIIVVCSTLLSIYKLYTYLTITAFQIIDIELRVGGYATVVMLAIPIIMCLIEITNSFFTKFLLCLMLSVNVVAILCSFSRSTWIGLFCGIVVFFILKKKVLPLVLILGILVIVLIFFLPKPLWQRFESLAKIEN